MFNNTKSFEFFDPAKAKKEINIVGSGAVGGCCGELLTRLGVPKLTIWDEDVVASHNLGNQIFRHKDIGKPKTDALEDILKEINPEIEIKKRGFVEVSDRLSGYIFLCIDNIDKRRELTEKWMKNPNIEFITDGRMRLTDGNIHSAAWNSIKEKENLLNSMQYTHEEAMKETPLSACGSTLSIVCTPRIIGALMVTNWIGFLNKKEYNRYIMCDSYSPFLESYIAN